MASSTSMTRTAGSGAPIGAAIAALGVVYGDLGTSPLYSIREAFVSPHHRLAVDRGNVLGAVSIIVWTLLIIIAVKYVAFVMRADNDGEGGILALTALLAPREQRLAPRAGVRTQSRRGPRTPFLVLLGLFGTSLLIGDGMITPAISVLSAVEGVELVHPAAARLVVPLSVAILVVLFSIQRFGTSTVGRFFGPVMLAWFVTMAVLGAASLLRRPEILQACNPVNALHYFRANGRRGFLSMGSLFLVVTGGEALYADLGHFGRRPIRLGWMGVVLPSLLLTYLGIGSLLLRHPDAIESPFFRLAPTTLQLPLIVLATVATVIASQALISGVFSITVQAVRLGWAPRTPIVNTSATARGQIYVPMVNALLALACVGLVLVFRSSARLAAAFGLSVTGTMFITTLLFAVFAVRHWRWNRVAVGLGAGIVLVIEGSFLAANAFKIPDGGWFPIVVGAAVVIQLTTWRTGRALVAAHTHAQATPLITFAASLQASSTVVRVHGDAVFLDSHPGFAPPCLLAHVRSSGSLHEGAYVVSVVHTDRPRELPARRIEHHPLDAGVHSLVLRYGFMETSPVAADLHQLLGLDPTRTDYFLSRETVRPSERREMARWRESLFSLMSRNAEDVADSFQLPPERVVELGTRVQI